MKTEAESRIPSLLVGIGVAAIGGLIAALLARKETRDLLRARGISFGRRPKGSSEKAKRC